MFVPRNLTGYEEFGLSQRYNLADGHAHQEQSATQRVILDDLPELFYRTEQTPQDVLEKRFVASFFRLAGQKAAIRSCFNFLSYSASVATEILANFLRQRELSVALIHPTFDNIAAILIGEGIPVVPMEEDALSSPGWREYLDTVKADALFLVCPNNPTGWVMEEEQFAQLVDHCRERGKMLIIDFCFRFFDPAMQWDQYALLTESGIDFITIEDTGKTWPTQDMKASVMSTNPGLAGEIHGLHTDVLLNVSPFILGLLTAYIGDTRRRGLDAGVHSVVKKNRDLLHAAVAGTLLRPAGRGQISADWLQVTGGLTGRQLWELLGERGVFVLPGDHFYWNDEQRGSEYIRVALMRPHALFEEAVGALRGALLDIAVERIA